MEYTVQYKMNYCKCVCIYLCRIQHVKRYVVHFNETRSPPQTIFITQNCRLNHLYDIQLGSVEIPGSNS